MSTQRAVSSIKIPIDNPDIELIHVAAQSTRLQILNLLTYEKKMYPTQLEKTLNIQRRVISFHLDALEKAKLVRSEFGLSKDSSRPQAVRYYSITPKGKEIFEMLLDMLKK
jgi:DNA-binding transcriptional ArsR family regulator